MYLNYKEVITSILFHGKSFEGRSNITQLFLTGLYIFWACILVFGFLLFFEFILRKITKKKIDLNKIFIEHFFEVALTVPLIILLAYPLSYIGKFLTFPYPIEYREAAMISPAIDFSKGINPYTIANYPDHIYLYGVLYPLMVKPFVNLFEHPILAARFNKRGIFSFVSWHVRLDFPKTERILYFNPNRDHNFIKFLLLYLVY